MAEHKLMPSGNLDAAPSRSVDWVKGLDSLRFVLALIVLLSHLPNAPSEYLRSLDSPLAKGLSVLLNHAFLGPGAVVAFFIISGFVIHYPFRDKPLQTKQFLVRRWVRIGIPMIVSIVVAFQRGGMTLIPIWSLYCELIYYTLYPLLRKIPGSWKQKFWISFFASLVVMFIGSYRSELNALLNQTNDNYQGSYASLGDLWTWLVGLPCWLMGVIIAENIDAIRRVVNRPKIYLIRAVVWGIAAIIVGLKAHWHVSYLFTLNLFAFPLAYWLTHEIIFFRTHTPNRFLEYAGKFSYSFYLFHFIIMMEFIRNFGMYPSLYPIAIVVIIATSWLIFLLVEDPAHRFSKFLARRL